DIFGVGVVAVEAGADHDRPGDAGPVQFIEQALRAAVLFRFPGPFLPGVHMRVDDHCRDPGSGASGRISFSARSSAQKSSGIANCIIRALFLASATDMAPGTTLATAG